MEPRGALWRADAALDALVSAEPLPPRAAPASGSAPPPLDAARCAPASGGIDPRVVARAGADVSAGSQRHADRPVGAGLVVARLQLVAPDCSVTLIFPSGQPVVLRRRLGPRAAAPASGAPATTTESSSVAARDRRRRAHHPIDAASRGSLPSRAAPIIPRHVTSGDEALLAVCFVLAAITPRTRTLAACLLVSVRH